MKLNFNLSSERIQQAVAEGIILSGKMMIDVDLESLPPADREVLSRNIEYREKEDAFYVNLMGDDSSDYRSVLNKVNSETLPGIIRDMKTSEQRRADYIVKQRQDKINSLVSFIQGETMRVLDTGIHDDMSGSFNYERLRSNYEALALENPTYEEVLKRASECEAQQAEARRLRTLAAEAKAAKEAAMKAAKETAREALAAWAAEHGSELLKLRIKHNQNWHDVAKEEWAKSSAPLGFEPWSADPDSTEDWMVNNGSVEQLRKLESAQAEKPAHKYFLMRSRWDENDYDESFHRTFIVCEVQTPVGAFPLYKEIEDADDND